MNQKTDQNSPPAVGLALRPSIFMRQREPAPMQELPFAETVGDINKICIELIGPFNPLRTE
jgi:hypothetical protein